MNKNNCDLKSEFDTTKSCINFFYENWYEGEFRHVKVVSSLPYDMYDLSIESEAKEKWIEKYNVPMPDDVYSLPAEVLSANCRVYDGEMVLTDVEKDHIRYCANKGDFTMEMLYLVLDGLKWRPLVPVDESDPGWLTIMERGDFDCIYLAIIREFLGMPEPGTDASSFLMGLEALVESYRMMLKDDAAAISGKSH